MTAAENIAKIRKGASVITSAKTFSDMQFRRDKAYAHVEGHASAGRLPMHIKLAYTAPTMSTLPIIVLLAVYMNVFYEKLGASLTYIRCVAPSFHFISCFFLISFFWFEQRRSTFLLVPWADGRHTVTARQASLVKASGTATARHRTVRLPGEAPGSCDGWGCHPSGSGALTRLVRAVHDVRPGAAARLAHFWKETLGGEACAQVCTCPYGYAHVPGASAQ